MNGCSFKVKVSVCVINQTELKVQTAHAMPSYQNDWFQSVLLGEKISVNNPSSQAPNVSSGSMIVHILHYWAHFQGEGSYTMIHWFPELEYEELWHRFMQELWLQSAFHQWGAQNCCCCSCHGLVIFLGLCVGKTVKALSDKLVFLCTAALSACWWQPASEPSCY